MKKNILLMIVGILLTGTAAQAQYRDSFPVPRDEFDMNRPSINGIRDEREVRRLVRMLYVGILFREPDWNGADFFADKIRYQGYSGVIEAASDMAYSEEFYRSVVNRYGARAVIENVYRVFFGRGLDSNAWGFVRQVERGEAHEAMRTIVSSSEFRRRNMTR